MSRIPMIAISVLFIVGASLSAYPSGFYEWTDEDGLAHFADSPDDIPAKFRSQAKAPKLDQQPKPAISQGSTLAVLPPPGASPALAVPSVGIVKPTIAPVAENEPAPRKFEIAYNPAEGTAKRVIINVTLNDAVTVPMALDTGSPGMVVSFQLADRLGLFSKDKDNGTLLVAAGGIGGTTPAVLTIVDSVSVEGARAAFVPTTVTASLSPNFDGLIGMDFMSGYTVSIDSTRQVVVFQETPARQDAPGGHEQEWWRKTFTEFRSTRDRWKAYAKSSGTDSIGSHKNVGEFQARESERLLERLSGYASDNAVPMEWR